MAEILGRYVEVWGAPVYYESAGEGQPIVGLHTAGRDNRQYHGWMHRLSDEYRVLAPDFPGHSKSWPLPGNRLVEDPEEMVDWIWAFCAAVGAESPVLAGCSMNGNFVLRLAQKHPSVRAVISMEGAAHTPTIPPGILELYTHPQVNFAQFIRGQSVGLIGSRADPEARAFLTWQVSQTMAECQRSDLRAYTAFDGRAGLGSIGCPVLFIRGEDDWLVSRDMVETTAQATPNSEVVFIPGGGHYIHAELPGEVCTLVRGFLSRRLGEQK